MFLHKDRELFREAVFATSAALSLPVAVIEKDYYVTMLLRSLAQKAPDCVLKAAHRFLSAFRQSTVFPKTSISPSPTALPAPSGAI